MKQKKTLLLGAHMSISGGFEKAIQRGESIGCTAIQIFTKSNRQWHAQKITNEQALLFKQTMTSSTIKIVIAHATYLINLGSPQKSVAEKSVLALVQELARCDQLDIPYLVLHPGSHLESGESICIKQIIENIDSALEQAQSNTMLLLETMAGQGTSVCYRFEDIATIINSSKNPTKIGVCFDTCHVFAAGYDFRDPETYKAMWLQFDAIVGYEKLKVIHLNDSKKDLGMHVDRHENIGKGKIGLNAFRLIINDKNLASVPKILETPKTTLEDDRNNISIIEKLVDN
ncbi:MAG: deoxyribonuclease IV [Candidatus Dependentiae bacterium]|jgi:deoxyribonuclease-4|nr:deoxyribonuclease IV [Candidatus Dependentiae bacterium]